MPDPQVITGTIATAGRLDKALAEASGLSRERVKALIADTCKVYVKRVAGA